MQRRASDAGVEQVCRLVGSLDIPTPWQIDDFIASVAARRRKPIHVMAYPDLSGPGHPCGVWIARGADDIILYDANTTGHHAEQIILHEVGHLLLDHRELPGGTASSVSVPRLLPDIDPDTVLQVLGRAVFDSDQESQAELFASLMLSQHRRRSRESKLLSTFLEE